jgi:regulator of sirC expression with transglutaminase-like and TPR domain
MLIGMRLNLPVEGIAAPGHFLARLDGIVFDPFHEGRILTDGEWELIASEVPARNRGFLTKACTPSQLMHRLLINLRNCYVKRNDASRRRMVDHYLAVLQR